LDLALNHQDQDQKPAPFRPVGHLPPLRGGRDGHSRGDLKPVPSLPPRSGGQIGRTADLHAEGARRANAMDGVSAPAPKGLKGALLILPCRPKIKIKSRPLPACRPPSAATRGKGQQLSRATGTRAFASPVHGGSSPKG